ncbi:glycosyltransferase [Duganella radicis]|uniref:Glycosyltransferase n=2 Tax=Duganella radicis TaxID=551988 RepID=A0A6L6PR51_9BURK|nr:glycosyltransferase [Duganella radicis]
MVGTSPAGKGGIATVVSVLQQAGFFEQQQARYLVTHADGSPWRKLGAALAAAWQVLSICLRERPAVVHVHSASRASFYRKSLLLALARLCGRATVFHLHGAEFKQFALQESGPLARWWIRRTLSKSSAVITLSESWATFLRELAPAARVRVIANSVRVPPPAEPAREQPARILFLGRADRRKGIFELLAALAQLAPRFPAARLVIGGDGDLALVAQTAEQLGVAQRVSILGWIDSAQREAELAQAAVFCLPSYDEGLPMAMLESMAAGKAVVVTPVGGIPEAIVDGVNGILVPPGDADALAAGLGRLFEDEALRRRVAEGARATIVARFGTEVVMSKMAELYRELAQARGD